MTSKCETPQDTSIIEITCKYNNKETLPDDILSIVGQAISKTNLNMVNHKNIPRIHLQEKWDNNNKHNGVQIQVTKERK